MKITSPIHHHLNLLWLKRAPQGSGEWSILMVMPCKQSLYSKVQQKLVRSTVWASFESKGIYGQIVYCVLAKNCFLLFFLSVYFECVIHVHFLTRCKTKSKHFVQYFLFNLLISFFRNYSHSARRKLFVAWHPQSDTEDHRPAGKVMYWCSDNRFDCMYLQ